MLATQNSSQQHAASDTSLYLPTNPEEDSRLDQVLKYLFEITSWDPRDHKGAHWLFMVVRALREAHPCVASPTRTEIAEQV